MIVMAEKTNSIPMVSLDIMGVTTLQQAVRMARYDSVLRAARRLGATRSDIFGLWIVPGIGELTEGQLLDLSART